MDLLYFGGHALLLQQLCRQGLLGSVAAVLHVGAGVGLGVAVLCAEAVATVSAVSHNLGNAVLAVVLVAFGLFGSGHRVHELGKVDSRGWGLSASHMT